VLVCMCVRVCECVCKRHRCVPHDVPCCAGKCVLVSMCVCACVSVKCVKDAAVFFMCTLLGRQVCVSMYVCACVSVCVTDTAVFLMM